MDVDSGKFIATVSRTWAVSIGSLPIAAGKSSFKASPDLEGAESRADESLSALSPGRAEKSEC
jgi:hypothetical protein